MLRYSLLPARKGGRKGCGRGADARSSKGCRAKCSALSEAMYGHSVFQDLTMEGSRAREGRTAGQLAAARLACLATAFTRKARTLSAD